MRTLAYTGATVGAAGLGVLIYSAITTKASLARRQEGRYSFQIVPSLGGFLITGRM